MLHKIVVSKSMYIEDANKRLWASCKAVTAGSSLYDVFIQPNAGSGHHIQLTLDEIDALTNMFSEITEDME